MTNRLTSIVVGAVLLVAACATGPGPQAADGSLVGATTGTTVARPHSLTTTTGPAPGRAPVTSATTPPPARSFTMAFTGDLLIHTAVNAAAARAAGAAADRDYDYRPLLAPIEPLIAGADWAVCHLEVNLSADGTRLSPYPRFRAPGQLAADVRDIGYDSCSVATNHSLDHGASGVTETLGVLDAAGLAHTGEARTATEALDGIWLDVGGVRIAHLSYTYSFNGFDVPADEPWLANLIDGDRILADAARARTDGAEYVIVSVHWGEQYTHELNRQQLDLGARLLAASDIDLVIGHHPHVVQRIDRLGGKWLVYSVGNLLSGYRQPARRDELLVEITATERPGGGFDTGLDVVPLYLDDTTTVRPSGPPRRDPTTDPGLADQLDASWSRVTAVLESGSGWGQFTLARPPLHDPLHDHDQGSDQGSDHRERPTGE